MLFGSFAHEVRTAVAQLKEKLPSELFVITRSLGGLEVEDGVVNNDKVIGLCKTEREAIVLMRLARKQALKGCKVQRRQSARSGRFYYAELVDPNEPFDGYESISFSIDKCSADRFVDYHLLSNKFREAWNRRKV
jgi:hypothetical protein